MKLRDITLRDIILNKAMTTIAFLGCLALMYAFFTHHDGFPDMNKPGAWVVFLIFAVLTTLCGRNVFVAWKRQKTADGNNDAPQDFR